MKDVKRLGKRIRGWFPKEPSLPSKKININGEGQKAVKFQFNKRFWMGLAVSYSLFIILVVVPFLLGNIDSAIVGYGLTGIGWSLVCMVMVYILNRRPELRMRVAYVAGGVWLGFAVFVLFALLLFPHQFLEAGSWSIILLITVVPFAGGLIGYLVGKRKYPTNINGVEEMEN